MAVTELRSPRITHISWGRMTIEGIGTGKDFKLYPGGGHAWMLDDVKDEAEYQHITHCSLCYVGFLDAREQLRASQEVSGGPTKRLPRPVEKKIGRTLDRLEQVMKSVAERR